MTDFRCAADSQRALRKRVTSSSARRRQRRNSQPLTRPGFGDAERDAQHEQRQRGAIGLAPQQCHAKHAPAIQRGQAKASLPHGCPCQRRQRIHGERDQDKSVGPPHRANDAGRGHASSYRTSALRKLRPDPREDLREDLRVACRRQFARLGAVVGRHRSARHLLHLPHAAPPARRPHPATRAPPRRCSAHAPTSSHPGHRPAAQRLVLALAHAHLDESATLVHGWLPGRKGAPALGRQGCGATNVIASLGPVHRAKAVLIRGSGV